MRTLFIFFIIAMAWHAEALSLPEVKVDLGKKLTLQSQSGEFKQQVYIRLPQGYADSKKHYPVIYLLDADLFYMDNLFFHSVNLIDRLAKTGQSGDIPESIIVGIPFQDMDNWYQQTIVDSEPLRSFITATLTGHIDKHYRTLDNSILVGQSYSGTFAIELLAKSPNTFDSVLAVDPIFPNQQKRQHITKAYQHMGKSDARLFNVQSEDPSKEVQTLLKTVQQYNRGAVDIQQQLFAEEGHLSVYYPALNSTLRRHFSDYRAPSKAQLKTRDMNYEAIVAYFSNKDKKYLTTTKVEVINRAAVSIAREYMLQKRFDLAFALYAYHPNEANLKYILNYTAEQFFNDRQYKDALTVWQHMADRFPGNDKAQAGIRSAKQKL